jgi:hypothetical protein
MRQNAGLILALYEFKRLISAIKYQELLPDPFEVHVPHECQIQAHRSRARHRHGSLIIPMRS